MSVDYIYIIFYKIIRLYIFLIFSKKFMVNFTCIIFVYLFMYYPSLCYKVSKKSPEWIPNYKVMQFWAQKSGPNLLICLK